MLTVLPVIAVGLEVALASSVVVLVAVVAVLVVLVVRATAARADQPVEWQGSSAPDVVPDDDDGVELRPVSGGIELWYPHGAKLATVHLAAPGGASRAISAPWARRGVTTLLRRARRAGPGPGGGRYRITIPADLASTLRDGGEIDVAIGAGRGVTALGRGLPAVIAPTAAALTVGTLALGIAQQQRLDRTLAVIDRRLGLVVDRLRDDDHGRLDAAEALLELIDGRVSELPSTQLRSELAVARQHVDAVYFARRRFAERLAEAIGDAQIAEESDSGAVRAWADGVLDAVADPDELRSELYVYLRALVVRARLATTTSAIVALDGDGADGSQLLTDTVSELRHDFYAIYRRMRPLAQWPPRRAMSLRRRDWERAHETVQEVFALMAEEIEPLLPPATAQPVALDVVVDDDGEVIDVMVLVDTADDGPAAGTGR